MRPILSIAMILITFSMFSLPTELAAATSKPAELAGEYAFTGQIDPVQTIHFPVVWAGNNDGRLQVKKYRDQGYTCQHKYRSFYRCKKFLSPFLPENIGQRISEKMQAQGSLIFGEYQNSELTVEGQSYKEWKVFQKVSYNGESYEFYKFMELEGGLQKISFGDFRRGTGVGFIVGDKGLQSMQIVRSDEHHYVNIVEFLSVQ